MLNRVCCQIVLLGLPMLLSAAGAYREVPTADKLNDKDLTFAVTFDTRGVNADFAKGDPISTTLKDVSLGLRGCVGFDTKQGFKPEPGEDLKFEALHNSSPHAGTATLWVNGLGYAPEDETTDGQKRGNIALLHMMFKQADQNIEYQLYEYGDTVYFDWRSSEPPQGWGQMGRVQVQRKGIKKNQWHQIAVTWTDKKLAIYLNGEFAHETILPVKAEKTSRLVPDANRSFLGLKSRFYEDNHTWDVAVDDLKIFSRALSPLEIKNQYAKLLLDPSAAIIQAYDVKLNGVNTGPVDKLDRLEAEFDFSALSEAEKVLLDQGKLVMDYRLTRANQVVAAGQWTFSQKNECKIMGGVDKPGTYVLDTRLGKTEKVSASIIRPDLSFAGTGVGDEDVVPEIWKEFAVKDRTVTLWNRVYQFGDGPLPTEIRAYGRSLLEKPPQLIIETPQGLANIRYQAGPSRHDNCAVTFTGTGQAAGFTLDYATTVEFDGMIKFDFTINGSPEIKSMRLEWGVKPELCQYLMTPLLQEGKNSQFEFQYPGGGWLTISQLWLVSEGKGGFAYSMSHDANWVYDPAQPVFFVNKASGQCSVTMITQTVKLPESTPYQALFIATPTRPLPVENRVIRFGDSSRSDTPRMSMNAGEGLTGVFTFDPHPTDFESRMKLRVPNTVSVYGAANSLTDASDVALYFKKYWDIPGAYAYKMSYQKPSENGIYETEYHLSIPACNAGLINDYYLYNIKKLLEKPYADRIWQIYYDLCGNDLCGNDLHGCAFKDKFGRNIKTFSILNKRKLVERTVRFCHAHNRTVMLHAQRSFSPFLHGLADYYFPGEQHNGLLARNPFGYTDEVPDALYRSEYNRDVLGVGVIFLPALGQAGIANYSKPEGFPYTEAMMTMLLSHDVETCQDYAAGVPIQKAWNALEKYGVQSPETRVHLYYNQKEITSSPSDVRITWYECPGNQTVLILANTDIRSRNATINVSAIASGDFTAREEYVGTDISVVAGKFDIRVPSRSFRIVAFPPKAFYPVQDDMDTVWGVWIGAESKSEFTSDRQAGHNKLGSLKMQAQGGGCFLKHFPVRPGRTYTASVYAKRDDVGSVSLAFQGKDQTNQFLVPPQSVKAEVGSQWQKIELRFTIPDTGDWANCNQLLITMGGDDGAIWFDDFTITEE